MAGRRIGGDANDHGDRESHHRLGPFGGRLEGNEFEAFFQFADEVLLGKKSHDLVRAHAFGANGVHLSC